MSYRFEVVESAVRSVEIAPCEDFPEGYKADYLVCVGYERQNGIGCYVGTVWNATKGEAAIVDDQGARNKYRRKMVHVDIARRWYEMVMSPSKFEVVS